MRRIVYEHHFDNELRGIVPDFEAADAFIAGVEDLEAQPGSWGEGP